MRNTLMVTAVIVLSSLVAACGGGGTSAGDGGTFPSPTASPSPDPAVSPSPSPTAPPSADLFTITGSMTAPGDSAIDSDTADLSVQRVVNDNADSPQLIRNPVTLGGFVAFEVDRFDVFEVDLVAGQQIDLFISGDGTDNDLDLRLADANRQVIAQSAGVSKFESLTVPGSGSATYFIEVSAFSGESNYVMTISQASASDAPQGAAHAMSTQAEFLPGQVLVKRTDADSAAPQARAQSIGGDWLAGVPGGVDLLDISTRAKAQVDGDLNGFQVSNSELAAKIATLKTLKHMARQPGVSHVEPNLIRRISVVPNDEFFDEQWHYRLINLPQAWDITTGSPAVTVAVADTGVRLNHPDLIGKFDPLDPNGFDFISDPQRSLDGDGIDGNADDPGDGSVAGNSSFHGTHVAGTVAAATDNGIGVAGAAWDTRIMPLRVLAEVGSSFDIINAVLYAAGLPNASGQLPPRPADLINLSLGGDTASQSEQQAYADAINAGLIVIAAAGNSGDERLSYPASYPGVVSVGAVGRQKQRAPYSQFNAQVDVVAPGGDVTRSSLDGILSTLSDDSGAAIRDGIGFLQGTSMAAPHMAGVVALMKAVHPGLTPNELNQLLASGAITEDLGVAGRDNQFGHGLIDANLAVREAVRLASGEPPADNPRLAVQPDALNFGNQLERLTVDVANVGTGDLALASVNADVEWLTVTPQAVSDDGLGRYDVAVDRSALTAGVFSAAITFVSDVNTVQVPVLVSVGNPTGNVDAGKQYVLLVDEASGAVLDQDEVQAVAGRYSFSFDAVPDGRYLLISGSDSDNDGLICDGGESCGAFPLLDSPRPVIVEGGNVEVADFLVSFGLGVSTATAQVIETPTVGLRRLK